MTAQQLKNSILQMAVQGKLVPQDPTDEPASVLLERIRAEKEQLIKAGKIKREKNPSRIFRGADNLPYEQVGKNAPVCIADEVPFEIPESWEWVRLGEIISFINGDRGKNYPSKDKLKSTGDIPFISAINMNNYTVSQDGLLYLSQAQYNLLGSGKLQKNDIVVCIRGSLGKCCIYPFDIGAIASSLVIFRKIGCIDNQFLLAYLQSPLFTDEIRKYDNGTAQPNLSVRDVQKFFIPIPPHSEQVRIIAKLQDIQPFIDKYNAAYISYERLNEAFPDQLKKSILQLAVQGKLVPQDPADEPASVLLERIRAEKEQLIRQGKIKRDKHESVIFRRDNSHYEKRGREEVCIDDEISFDLPDSWEWIRLGSLVQVNPRNNLPDDTDVGFMPMPLLKEGFNNQHTFETRRWGEVKSGFTHFANGDVVIAKITPCFQNRKSAVMADLPNGYGAGTTELHVLRDNTHLLYMPYLLLLCKTHDFITAGMKNFTGTAGQQRVGKDFISNYLVPLPPVHEQKRIVETAWSIISEISRLVD